MALSASPFTSPPGSQRFDFGTSVAGPTDEHVKSDEDDMMHQGNGEHHHHHHQQQQQQQQDTSQQRLLPQQPYESLRPQLSDAYNAPESVDLNSGGAAGGGVSSGPNQRPSTECLLPDMTPYLPEGADRDAAATLSGLYQAYCHSLAESIRFMRLKQFNLTCLSFYRSLTVPVQRVLAYPSLQIWIQKADWIMYKVIVKLLSQLALSVVPPVILSAVRSLAMTLAETIHQGFMMVSEELVQSKLVPARAFIALVLRLLRVNETAHAAGKILAHDSDRELMKSDWQKFVNARQVVQQDIPCGSTKVERILSEGVSDLLTLPEREGANDANEDASGSGGTSTSNGTSRSGSRASEDIIERWAVYLELLPRQFSNVSKRLFLLCASTVVTSALREITLSGGAAFGAWWVVRCWIDEWLSWTAERDGFMATSYVSPDDGNFDILNSGSRLKGLEMETIKSEQSTATIKQQEQQQSPKQQQQQQGPSGNELGKQEDGSNQEREMHHQTSISGQCSPGGQSKGEERSPQTHYGDGRQQERGDDGEEEEEDDDDEMQPTEETDPELIRKIIETLPSG